MAFVVNGNSYAIASRIPNCARTKKPWSMLKFIQQIRQTIPSLCFDESSDSNRNVNEGHKIYGG